MPMPGQSSLSGLLIVTPAIAFSARAAGLLAISAARFGAATIVDFGDGATVFGAPLFDARDECHTFERLLPAISSSVRPVFTDVSSESSVSGSPGCAAS